jgi:hypothetical protein
MFLLELQATAKVRTPGISKTLRVAKWDVPIAAQKCRFGTSSRTVAQKLWGMAMSSGQAARLNWQESPASPSNLATIWLLSVFLRFQGIGTEELTS